MHPPPSDRPQMLLTIAYVRDEKERPVNFHLSLRDAC